KRAGAVILGFEAYVVVDVLFFFFFQAEDGIRDSSVTGVQTCALPISSGWRCCAAFHCFCLISSSPTERCPRSNAILAPKARSGGRLARFFDSPPSPASLPCSACCASTRPRAGARGIAVAVARREGARKPLMAGVSTASVPLIAPVLAIADA